MKKDKVDIKKRLIEIYQENIKSEVDLDKSFLELGGNSVSVFIIIDIINQEFNLSLEPEVFFNNKTSSINSLANEISSKFMEEKNLDYTFFKENGYLGPFKLKESLDMTNLWNNVRLKLLSRKTAAFKESKLNYDRHLDISEISDIVKSKEITEKIKNIIGDDVKCWRTEWFPKYPGDGGTEWHQAKNFFEFEGEPKVIPTKNSPEFWGLTVWVAFTDSTIENGCMRVIPKSHAISYFDEEKKVEFDDSLEAQKNKDNFYGYSWDKLKKDSDWKPNLNESLNLEMKAGEFFIFTSQLLHGSLPNISENQSRYAMSIRYVSGDVEVYPNIDEFKALGETLKLDNYKTLKV